MAQRRADARQRKDEDVYGAGDIVIIGLWFGLVAGLVEGVINMTLQLTTNRLMGVWTEIIWIAPLANLLLFGGLAAVLTIASKLWPRLPWLVVSVAAFVGLTALDWLALTLYSYIYTVVIVLLVAGITLQAVRWFRGHERAALRFWRHTLPWVAGLTALALVAIQGGQFARERLALNNLPELPAGAPNVLVLVVDALRADHLSAYGYSRATTPNLARLAEDGVLFERAYATASYTLPSHASLLTGLYPNQHGVQWQQPKTLFDGAYPTLAETLQTGGYRTGAFSANTFWFTREEGFDRGFMHFEDFFASPADMILRTVYGRMFERFILRRVGFEDIPARKRAPSMNDALLRWIGETSKTPFLAFVNYMDVHDPYLPPEPYRSLYSDEGQPGGLLNWRLDREDIQLTPQERQSEIDAYDGAVTFVDAQIQALLDELQARGLSDNLLVVITSDHGDAFDEHGTYLHAKSLYSEEIRIPLIVWQPELMPAGVRVAQPVSNAAVPATVLDLVGLDGTADVQTTLAPLWQQPAVAEEWAAPLSEMEHRPWTSENYPVHYGSIKSLVSPEWHYIEHETLGVELFALEGDPAESENVAENPEVQPALDSFHSALDTVLESDSLHVARLK